MWTEILSLEMIIFALKVMVESGLERAQNLATGWDSMGLFEAVPFCPGTSHRTKFCPLILFSEFFCPMTKGQ